ncbi:MAG: DUF4386 family protein [Candidatus Heimdallarchaeota archaeon]
MQDRTLLRIGAVSLIAGFVSNIIFAVLHQMTAPPSDPSDMEATLQQIADSSTWAGIHVFIMAAFLLFVGGLLALSRSFTEEPGAALARLGFSAALLGVAILSVSEAILGGSTMKELADAWAAAADKEGPFAVAEAMLLVSYDIFSWGNVVFYGVTPILFGLAIVLSDLYPKWLGWVAVVGGIGNVLIGIVLFSQGWSQGTNIVWNLFIFVITLWLLVMGVLMWRKAGAAANP